MKISQIKFTNEIKIESPTDAVHRLQNAKQVNYYIFLFGDVETEFDTASNIYRVPAFAEKIEAYTKMKMENCIRYGSN